MQERTKTEQEDRDTKDSLTDLIDGCPTADCSGARRRDGRALGHQCGPMRCGGVCHGRQQRSSSAASNSAGDWPGDGADSQSAESPGQARALSSSAGASVCKQDGQSGSGDPVVVLERHLDRGDAAGPGSAGGAVGQGAVGQYGGSTQTGLAGGI